MSLVVGSKHQRLHSGIGGKDGASGAQKALFVKANKTGGMGATSIRTADSPRVGTREREARFL